MAEDLCLVLMLIELVKPQVKQFGLWVISIFSYKSRETKKPKVIEVRFGKFFWEAMKSPIKQ